MHTYRSIKAALALLVAGGFCGAALARDVALPTSTTYLTGVQTQPTPAGLRVAFGTKDQYPNILWKSPSADGWDWSDHSAVVFSLANPGTTDIAFHIKVSAHSANGKKHSVTGSGVLKASAKERFFLSLLPRSLQETSGMRNLPMTTNPEWGAFLTKGIEPKHVDDYQIFLVKPAQTKTLVIESVTLAGPPPLVNLNGLIDRYGQSTLSDWQDKIHTDNDFAARKAVEEKDFAANARTDGRDKWGGWSEGPRRKATGYFRTEQIDGRWWMVTPDGNLFLSVGMDVVNAPGDTIVQGRETMFADLPASTAPFGQYYSDDKRAYNFLRANIARKYGTFDLDTFGDLAVKRLRSWGFNSFGNWSSEQIALKQSFPYVVALALPPNIPSVPSGISYGGGRIMDPFAPGFPDTVDTAVRAKTALHKNNPACIGYFFDNELSWGMPSVDREHFGLCVGTLKQGASIPAKQAFVAMVQKRYASVDALNAAWKTRFVSWEQFASPSNVSAENLSAEQRQDFSDFLTLFAEKYFDTVSRAIKRADPDHLYLGCRFAYWFTPEAVQASARYADVISFNIYTWNPDVYRFAQQLGKPCIVGEFHFGATDRGMFSGNITVANQQERAARYETAIRQFLGEPAFIGCHWFQLYDEPTVGRPSDGENFNIGFLSTTDTPYWELIDGARKANAEIYKIHANALVAP